jgi:hypothetical protein
VVDEDSIPAKSEGGRCQVNQNTVKEGIHTTAKKAEPGAMVLWLYRSQGLPTLPSQRRLSAHPLHQVHLPHQPNQGQFNTPISPLNCEESASWRG